MLRTESTKQTNMCGNRSTASPDVRSFYCQPSSITSYHGSDMSVVMIRCRIPYYNEQWMVVVAEEYLVNHEGQHQRMDRPVDVVIDAHQG